MNQETSKPVILYVDDEQENLDNFKFLFRSHYHVHTAISSSEAEKLLLQHDIRVVIADQRMPEETGVEFLTKIVDRFPPMVRMILTGYSDIDTVINAVNKGKIYHYFKKPFEAEEVLRVIDNALETVNLERENLELIKKLKAGSACLQAEIDERKKAEATIRISEELWDRTFNAIYDIVTIQDADLKIVKANHATSTVLNLSESEIIGQHCYKLFQDLDEPCQDCPLPSTIKTFKPYSKEMHLEKLGKTLLVSVSPLCNEQGELEYVAHTAKDITETQQLQKLLLQSQKMESIGTLAGGIAHDFNNILSSVLGYTELALNTVEKETPIAEDLQEVYAAGLRAKDLVKQILTVARQSDEKLKPTQVGNIILEVLKFIRSSIPTTIEIKQDIQSDSLIMANSTELHRIMMNLCTNAAQAMENSGGTLEITLNDINFIKATKIGTSTAKPGKYIEIKVSDTGDGIDPHVIGKIFDPYFTTKGPAEGTGMGLAMVHGIVETYGGNILVESTPGRGTVFTIYLPTGRNGDVHFKYKTEELQTGQERILFVDDDVQIAKMTRRVLEGLGYSVTTMTNSLEALELFRSKPNDFDLVISDVTMPKMTGDQLATELIQVRSDIPVILCTGYNKKLSEEKATEMGIKAFAYKPIVKEDLAKTVRKVLDNMT